MKEGLALKIVVTAGAILTIIARAAWPNLTIDAVTFGLILVALLPWLSGIIKSAEFPGGWKIEFQDMKKAGEKVVADITAETPAKAPPRNRGKTPAKLRVKSTVKSQPSFLSVASQDPNLALVGLRIEIEKRIRAIAERSDLPPSAPLSQLLREMQSRGVIAGSSASGLQELVQAGNQAAHGARVEPSVADWAMHYGPTVLASLDSKLRD